MSYGEVNFFSLDDYYVSKKGLPLTLVWIICHSISINLCFNGKKVLWAKNADFSFEEIHTITPNIVCDTKWENKFSFLVGTSLNYRAFKVSIVHTVQIIYNETSKLLSWCPSPPVQCQKHFFRQEKGKVFIL